MSTAWYVESSVLLTLAYGQPGALDAREFGPTCTSVLTRVECMRSIDRHRLLGRLSDQGLSDCRDTVFRMTRTIRMVAMDADILDRASAPILVPLKTLDAIHLVTALQWREDTGDDLVFATHDRGLAAAARAYGLAVVGA